MSRSILIALWAFMLANPGANFDAFVSAYYRALALEARERERNHA